MNCQPPEIRIITALVLGAMSPGELGALLTLDRMHVYHRMAWLRGAGFVCIHSHTKAIPRRRSATRFTLTPRGQTWAGEIMS